MRGDFNGRRFSVQGAQLLWCSRVNRFFFFLCVCVRRLGIASHGIAFSNC